MLYFNHTKQNERNIELERSLAKKFGSSIHSSSSTMADSTAACTPLEERNDELEAAARDDFLSSPMSDETVACFSSERDYDLEAALNKKFGVSDNSVSSPMSDVTVVCYPSQERNYELEVALNRKFGLG